MCELKHGDTCFHSKSKIFLSTCQPNACGISSDEKKKTTKKVNVQYLIMSESPGVGKSTSIKKEVDQ